MAYDDIFAKGTNSHNDAQVIEVMLRDSSTGQGKTALTYLDVTAYYVRQGDASATAITLASGTLGTYTDSGAAGTGGGFVKVHDTNAPGLYQLSIPDACLATGANSVTIHLKATGMINKAIRLLLVASDLRTLLAPDSTALSNATWTGTKAGYLDYSVLSVSASAGSILSNTAATLSSLANMAQSAHVAAAQAAITSNYPTWSTLATSAEVAAAQAATIAAMPNVSTLATSASLSAAQAELDARINSVASSAALAAAQSAITAAMPSTTGLATSANVAAAQAALSLLVGSAATSANLSVATAQVSGYVAAGQQATQATINGQPWGGQLNAVISSLATAQDSIDALPGTAAITAAIEALASYKSLIGAAKGKTVVTDNGDNTYTVQVYGTDNATLLHTLTVTSAGRTVA